MSRLAKSRATGKDVQSAIGKKISFLRHEGKPQKQAVGEAMGMARAGRLTSEGGYIRAKKKK